MGLYVINLPAMGLIDPIDAISECIPKLYFVLII